MNWKTTGLLAVLLITVVLAPQARAVSPMVSVSETNAAVMPAVPDFSPGPDYADSARMFQGIPGIERAANGRLWATWYGGGVTEDAHNYILLFTSGDGGASWQQVLVLDPDGAGPVRAFDPCLWIDPSGKLWLFWSQEIAGNPGRVSLSFAIATPEPTRADATWSAPRAISKGVMMNKPIVTSDGRWLLPMATWFTNGSARAVVSVDRGETFADLGAANIVDKKSRNADEHMLVERKDGSLWMLVRGIFPLDGKAFTGIGESVSTDGGKTWSDVKASSLPHSTSRFFLRKLAGGNLLLVRHDPPGGKKVRSHLTAFLSTDDGRTWGGGLVLDVRNGVSYPDGVQAADGTICLIYDFDRGGAKQILMATFTEEDVRKGQWISAQARQRVLINQATGKRAPPAKAAGSAAAQPLARWSCEEVRGGKVQDVVGKLSGTVKGAPQQVPGVEGQALKFDGDLVSVSSSPALCFTDATFSVSAWVNPYDVSGGQQMIMAKNAYAAGQREWGLMLDRDNRFRFYVSQKGWKTIAAQTVPQAGHWYHLAVTVGRGQGCLYLNGKQEGSGPLVPSILATEAPLTIGGVQDGARVTQTFIGALDEVALYRGVLTPAEIRALAERQPAPHKLESIVPVQLWGGGAVPKSAELSALEGVDFHVIKAHEPAKDGYPWLHGVGLAWHQGKLYASFGHNKGAENTATEEARGRVSADGGKTWGDVFTIDTGTEAPDLAISHGVFLSHGGALWAFHGAFYGRMGRIHTRAYQLDEATGKWQPKGVVVEGGFWALNQPVKMGDGNWLMAGICAGVFSEKNVNPAAVAISHGDDFTKWDLVSIPASKGLKMWGESAVMVDGPRVTNIARYGAKALALVAESADYGRTWTASASGNLPMATSKPCAGLLSNGQRYLVCTTTADTGGRRNPLTIAVSKPGEKLLSKIFVIRPAMFPAGPGESNERASLSYPCATEHDGKLYVGYSNSGGRGGNNNSAELAVIPIKAISVNP
jgi:predicted neuraminidase